MRKYREYTDEDIIRESKNVKSIAGLLEKLNLKQAGGNYINMKKNLQRLEVDCSHWTGQAWNKDQQLKDWSDYSRASHLREHLIREKTHKCSFCKLTKWFDKPIPLEIHHIDGDRTNNNLENLRLLCCNCHGLTINWRNRKRL
jgi:hypothetical protein